MIKKIKCIYILFWWRKRIRWSSNLHSKCLFQNWNLNFFNYVNKTELLHLVSSKNKYFLFSKFKINIWGIFLRTRSKIVTKNSTSITICDGFRQKSLSKLWHQPDISNHWHCVGYLFRQNFRQKTWQSVQISVRIILTDCQSVSTVHQYFWRVGRNGHFDQ